MRLLAIGIVAALGTCSSGWASDTEAEGSRSPLANGGHEAPFFRGYTEKAKTSGDDVLSAKDWGPPPPSEWGKNNLHLVERDAMTGFEIYRMSKPDRADMRRLCRLGITEIMVLSGTARKRELKYAAECPKLRVVYNEEQSTSKPLDRRFLNDFDSWVEDARRQGRKIAFRCECGCHRTGRLAAYYQMKFQHLSLEDALTLLEAHGYWMAFYPHIFKQTRALADYVAGRPCSLERKYCVRD